MCLARRFTPHEEHSDARLMNIHSHWNIQLRAARPVVMMCLPDLTAMHKTQTSGRWQFKCCTLVRSKQSTQFVRTTPFCSLYRQSTTHVKRRMEERSQKRASNMHTVSRCVLTMSVVAVTQPRFAFTVSAFLKPLRLWTAGARATQGKQECRCSPSCKTTESVCFRASFQIRLCSRCQKACDANRKSACKKLKHHSSNLSRMNTIHPRNLSIKLP